MSNFPGACVNVRMDPREQILAQQPKEVRATDAVPGPLLDGALVRVLTRIDRHPREGLALAAQRRLRGAGGARLVSGVIALRSPPARITVDNGSAFTPGALDALAYWNHVQLDCSEFVIGSLRRGCLSPHWLASITEAPDSLNNWKGDDNTARPHSSLQHHSPATRFMGGQFNPNADGLAFLHV